MSLIVDHSKEGDRHWPAMLSNLIHGGITDYFIGVALLSVPDQRHPKYRDICRVKVDALTGLARCFEQILARDIACVRADVAEILGGLIDDENMPMLVQATAAWAIQVWNR